MKFAAILGHINTRILLTVFYIVGLTPTGFIMKMLGKDPMRRRFKDKSVSSYWSHEAPPAEGVRHFNNQF